MTQEQLKSKILALDEHQVNSFNSRTETKMYSAVEPTMTFIKFLAVVEVVESIEALNDQDLSSLNNNLPNYRKLSQRPC